MEDAGGDLFLRSGQLSWIGDFDGAVVVSISTPCFEV